jgi:membrane protease YdiL (CAAX protease family)
MLPTSVPAVLVLCAVELGLFGIAFLLATALARFRAPELLLTTPFRWWAWPRAIAWSIALRIGVAILLICAFAALQLARGQPFDALDPAIARPKVEAIVNTDALRDPLYLVLMLTVVSFILAGLREELWRVGMIALLARLAPSCFGGRLGPWLALVPVAILFGLGHTPQGWAGVAATTVLGLGLGAIMLLHRSLWDAVLAHGFFNATTFALLPWIAHLIPQARG